MNKWLITLAALSLMIVVGCEDTSSETIAGLTRDGFIKGNVVTERHYDTRSMNFSFEHSVQDYPTEFELGDGGQTIWIYRTPTFEADWNGDEYSQLGIYLDSLDQDTVQFYYGNFESMVSVGDTSVYFRMNGYNNGRILSYHYDESTNTMSGTFTATGTSYYGKPATVTGSFETKVRKAVYKPSDKKQLISVINP